MPSFVPGITNSKHTPSLFKNFLFKSVISNAEQAIIIFYVSIFVLRYTVYHYFRSNKFTCRLLDKSDFVIPVKCNNRLIKSRTKTVFLYFKLNYLLYMYFKTLTYINTHTLMNSHTNTYLY